MAVFRVVCFMFILLVGIRSTRSVREGEGGRRGRPGTVCDLYLCVNMNPVPVMMPSRGRFGLVWRDLLCEATSAGRREGDKR